MKKTELMEDLEFCQELMNRLVKFADIYYTDSICDNKYTVIQRVIIRLRRELNEIRNKLEQ